MSGLGRDTPLPQHLKVKTSRVLYTTDEEVRDALMEFGVFIIFLVLTSLVTLSVRHPHMFYFNDTMMKLFTTRNLTVVPSVTVSFEKMLTVPDWWDYLVYNFINTLHGDMTSSTSTSPRSKSVNEAKTDRSSFKSSEDILYVEDGDVERNDESSRRKRETGPALPYGEIDEIDRDENLDGLDLDLDLSAQIGETTKSRSARSDTASETVPWAESSLNLTTHLNGRLFLHENLMLGPPRLRQIRVSKNSCQTDGNFPQNFNTCYAAYFNAAEENSEWHKGTSIPNNARTGRHPDLDFTGLLSLWARYFQNIPPDVQNRELFRLTNRVSLIEEVLEQLVTNIDSILQRFERQQGVRKT
ncbi:GL14538 [Drosophila persimilis]|uniref:GL14538 n=1 Tax=Drosophila persimilis TaxID=7234 RepID=B4GW47_DROPE|nr:GL14538 [Drosophila persimilis]